MRWDWLNGGKGWLGKINAAVCLERRVERIVLGRQAGKSDVEYSLVWKKEFFLKISEYNLDLRNH